MTFQLLMNVTFDLNGKYQQTIQGYRPGSIFERADIGEVDETDPIRACEKIAKMESNGDDLYETGDVLILYISNDRHFFTLDVEKNVFVEIEEPTGKGEGFCHIDFFTAEPTLYRELFDAGKQLTFPEEVSKRLTNISIKATKPWVKNI